MENGILYQPTSSNVNPFVSQGNPRHTSSYCSRSSAKRRATASSSSAWSRLNLGQWNPMGIPVCPMVLYIYNIISIIYIIIYIYNIHILYIILYTYTYTYIYYICYPIAIQWLMWQVLLQKVTTHPANQRNMDIGFRLMILRLEVGHGLHKDQNQDGKKHSIIQ